MDPKGQRISHALFRDCTKYDNGAYIKVRKNSKILYFFIEFSILSSLRLHPNKIFHFWFFSIIAFNSIKEKLQRSNYICAQLKFHIFVFSKNFHSQNFWKIPPFKDLSHLNRDLSRVIYIDWDPEAFQLNPDNVLRVPKWEGDDKDTWLIELAELLKSRKFIWKSPYKPEKNLIELLVLKTKFSGALRSAKTFFFKI